jgi:hypothetical protein
MILDSTAGEPGKPLFQRSPKMVEAISRLTLFEAVCKDKTPLLAKCLAESGLRGYDLGSDVDELPPKARVISP